MPSMARDRIRQSDLRQALDAHLRGLPADAPLRNVIARPEIEATLVEFDSADVLAVKTQRSYRRLGRVALWAMMIGAIVGALVLLPIDPWLAGWRRRAIEGLQALALVLTFAAVAWIALRQSILQWMQCRSEAERLRAEVFRAILRAGIDVKELLPAALACFRHAHLDWQLNFFRRRGIQHRKAAGLATPYNVAGYLILAFAVCLGVAGLVSLAADMGLAVWPSVKTAIQRLLPHEHARWQLGLGAVASSILAFASARTFMDQDDRNAACYALTAEKLGNLRDRDLRSAEEAADSGRAAEVMAFCEAVQGILDAEHLAWRFARPPGVPIAPKPHL